MLVLQASVTVSAHASLNPLSLLCAAVPRLQERGPEKGELSWPGLWDFRCVRARAHSFLLLCYLMSVAQHQPGALRLRVEQSLEMQT